MLTNDIYSPVPWAKEMHEMEDTPEMIARVPRGAGKTTALLMDPLYDIVDAEEPVDAIYMQRIYESLAPAIEKSWAVFPKIDKGAEFSRFRLRWKFSNGSTYEFGHMHRPEDSFVYASRRYIVVCMDEVDKFTEEQYLRMKHCLRSRDVNAKVRLRAACSILPDWANLQAVWEPNAKTLDKRWVA